ncbi:MAG: hypothetical protein U5K27_02075 [Desulfotignum sp.]|nr:hypothetical protein [Desulfotignum sp.]
MLADAQEKGQVSDMSAFEDMTRTMAEAIAGGPVAAITSHDTTWHLPGPLRQVFDAMLTGIARRYDPSDGARAPAADPDPVTGMAASGPPDAPDMSVIAEPENSVPSMPSLSGQIPPADYLPWGRCSPRPCMPWVPGTGSSPTPPSVRPRRIPSCGKDRDPAPGECGKDPFPEPGPGAGQPVHANPGGSRPSEGSAFPWSSFRTRSHLRRSVPIHGNWENSPAQLKQLGRS